MECSRMVIVKGPADAVYFPSGPNRLEALSYFPFSTARP